VYSPNRSNKSTRSHVPPVFKQGIVVESISDHSEASKAGLAEGDLLLGWSRGNAKGDVNSPFDLSTIETQQAPRGQVSLMGFRGDANRTWVLGPGRWSLKAHPQVPSELLAPYRASQDAIVAHQFPQAEDMFNAVATAATRAGCSAVMTWLLFHAADAFADAKEWKRAEAFYVRALDSAKTDPSAAISILRAWADASVRHGDLVSAERHDRMAMQIAARAGPDSLSLAESLTALGSALTDEGKLKEAHPYLVKARQIDEKLAPDSLPLAADINGLAIIEDERGQLDQAEKDYQRRALSIRQKISPDSLPVASTEQDLGIVAEERGDLDKATDYNLKALAIREKLAPGSRALAVSLNTLGDSVILTR